MEKLEGQEAADFDQEPPPCIRRGQKGPLGPPPPGARCLFPSVFSAQVAREDAVEVAVIVVDQGCRSRGRGRDPLDLCASKVFDMEISLFVPAAMDFLHQLSTASNTRSDRCSVAPASPGRAASGDDGPALQVSTNNPFHHCAGPVCSGWHWLPSQCCRCQGGVSSGAHGCAVLPALSCSAAYPSNQAPLKTP